LAIMRQSRTALDVVPTTIMSIKLRVAAEKMDARRAPELACLYVDPVRLLLSRSGSAPFVLYGTKSRDKAVRLFQVMQMLNERCTMTRIDEQEVDAAARTGLSTLQIIKLAAPFGCHRSDPTRHPAMSC
jgi:hypothetical protein